jgi:uncharacterized protein (DUF58 family)
MTTNLSTGKHVVVTDFDRGEGILVDLNTRRYYQLNESAMIVWKGLEQGKTVSQIVDDFTSTYEIEPDRAAVSVERLVNTLQTYNLVSAK